MNHEKQALIASLIQAIGCHLKIPLYFIDSAVHAMHQFNANCPLKAPAVHLAICVIQLVTKYNDLLIKPSHTIKYAYMVIGRVYDEKIEDILQEVKSLESLILATIGIHSLNFRSPDKIISKISLRYDLPSSFTDVITTMTKSIYYLTDMSSIYSAEEIVSAAMFMTLRLNNLDLEDIDNLSWYSHILRSITLDDIKVLVKYFSKCCDVIDSEIKAKIFRFIQKSNVISPKRHSPENNKLSPNEVEVTSTKESNNHALKSTKQKCSSFKRPHPESPQGNLKKVKMNTSLNCR